MGLLSQLSIGGTGVVTEVRAEPLYRRRLLEMGFVPGTQLRVVRAAPLGDPIEVALRGFHVSLRRDQASGILLRSGPTHSNTAEESVAPTMRVERIAARQPASSEGKPSRIVLLGNPNTGKSTLFARLTGTRSRTGNFPGTTVELRSGGFAVTPSRAATLIDLPGVYSIHPQSSDETITIDALLGHGRIPRPSVVLVVLSATALERSLYLLLQVLEFGVPTVVAVNMADEAQKLNQPVDTDRLSSRLAVPCIATDARRGHGMKPLCSALAGQIEQESWLSHWFWQPTPRLTQQLRTAAETQSDAQLAVADSTALALWRLLEAQCQAAEPETPQQEPAESAEPPCATDDPMLEAATARYRAIEQIAAEAAAVDALSRPSIAPRRSALDRWLTHPVAGLLTFLSLMLLLFTAVFDWAVPLMDAIDAGFSALAERLSGALPPGLFSDVISNGLLRGVGSVVVFLPQILILLLVIRLLEGSGYMARAAFMIDRLMRALGLNGRAFVPMLSGYACAIPAVLATRTMKRRRDRLLTMAVVPLISCSARLPVYTLIIASLFPAEKKVLGPFSLGALSMLALYLISTVLALAAAGVLGHTLLKGPQSSLLLELPPYRLPALRSIFLPLWRNTLDFLKTAGSVIVIASVILWVLLNYPRVAERAPLRPPSTETARPSATDRARLRGEQLQHSYAARIGRLLEPAIAPLGFDWKIGVGLVGAFAAREVFVATMGLIYGVGEDADEHSPSLREVIRKARRPDGSPVYTPLVALSLIVFFMIALQCVSTLAIIRQESRSWKWPLFVFGYLSILAYLASLLTYQVGRVLGFS